MYYATARQWAARNRPSNQPYHSMHGTNALVGTSQAHTPWATHHATAPYATAPHYVAATPRGPRTPAAIAARLRWYRNAGYRSTVAARLRHYCTVGH